MLTAHSNIHNTTDSLPFTCPLIHPLIMGVQAWNNAAYDYLAGNSRLRAVLGQFVVSSMCWSTLCCHFKVNVEECSSGTRIRPNRLQMQRKQRAEVAQLTTLQSALCIWSGYQQKRE
ncbi:hypothetical protein ACLKA7_009822 [Drosophila subpalustris]